MARALSIIIILILLIATAWAVYHINTDFQPQISITTNIKDFDSNQNIQIQTTQTQTISTPLTQPILTNIDIQNISIADSVYLVNLFNPDIIGKENIKYSVAHVTLEPGSSIPLRSLKNNEVQYYAKGKGRIILNGKSYEVEAGDALFIPKNTIQKTMNRGSKDFEILSIVNPAWTPSIEQRYE